MEVLEKYWVYILREWKERYVLEVPEKYPPFGEARRLVRYASDATEDITEPEYNEWMKTIFSKGG